MNGIKFLPPKQGPGPWTTTRITSYPHTATQSTYAPHLKGLLCIFALGQGAAFRRDRHPAENASLRHVGTGEKEAGTRGFGILQELHREAISWDPRGRTKECGTPTRSRSGQ